MVLTLNDLDVVTLDDVVALNGVTLNEVVSLNEATSLDESLDEVVSEVVRVMVSSEVVTLNDVMMPLN